MGLDNSTLLTVTAQELVDVKLAEMGPAFDDIICTPKLVDAIEGTFPYYAAKDQAGKDLGSTAIGADPTPVDFDLSSVSYACERYSHSCQLDQSEIQDLGQYSGALDPKIELPMYYNRVARESDLHALMTDSGSNGQQAAANGNWSVTTSTPYEDMQLLQLNDVPLIDMVVISFKTLQELQRHPDTAQMLNAGFAGSGVFGASAVRSAIASVYEIDPSRVFVWKTIENTAKFGQSFALGRIMDEFFWAGQQQGLVKVSQIGQQNRATVETDHLQIDNAVHDTCDYLRVETFAGGEITGL